MSLKMKVRRVFTAIIGPLARASNQLVTLCLTLVAMRYLPPSEFGVFALAVLATTIIRTLLYSGSFEYFLRTKEPRSASSEVLIFNAFLAAVSSLLVLVGAVVAAWLGYDGHVLTVLLLLLPSNFISAVCAWQEAHLLRTGRITSYYITTIAAECLSMAGAVAMFVAGFGISALIAQIYIRNALLSLMYLGLLRPFLSDRVSMRRMKEIFHWALPVYGSSSLGLISNYSADLLLGLMLSPAATGIYRASNRLVTAVADIFNQPTRLASMTLTSKAVANGAEGGTQWVYVFTLAAMVGWSALAGLAVTAGQLVPVVLGPQWVAAAPVVSILCAARAFSLLDSAMSPALVAHSRQHALFKVQLTSTTVLFLLMVMLASFGLEAAAAVVLAAAVVKSFMIFSLIRRSLGGAGAAFRKNLPLVLVPPTAVAGVAALVSILSEDNLPAMVAAAATIMAGVMAWLLCLALFRQRLSSMLTLAKAPG